MLTNVLRNGMESGMQRDHSAVFSLVTPEEAVAKLAEMHRSACVSLRAALRRYAEDGVVPTAEDRHTFRYPLLRVTWKSCGKPRFTWRAWAKFQAPGTYETTVTQPDHFRAYLLEQLRPLVHEFGATIEVGPSEQEIPYPYVAVNGDEFAQGAVEASELARHFPTPALSAVGDEIVDGTWEFRPGAPRPLALFDAARVDYSLKRLAHYTGTPWSTIQPWILLTNYQRYVDQFVQHGLSELTRADSQYTRLVMPGCEVVSKGIGQVDAQTAAAAAPWQRYQMPAFSLERDDGQGITIINIGVGPSNAKNITDHLAVLRPNCWLMIGHCGGLRQSQVIGDYVLAHAYLRRDKILDDLVPPEIPIPALAEVQVALQEAAAAVTGDRGEALKRRLRTGTVVTYDDRNGDPEMRVDLRRRRFSFGPPPSFHCWRIIRPDAPLPLSPVTARGRRLGRPSRRPGCRNRN